MVRVTIVVLTALVLLHVHNAVKSRRAGNKFVYKVSLGFAVFTAADLLYFVFWFPK